MQILYASPPFVKTYTLKVLRADRLLSAYPTRIPGSVYAPACCLPLPQCHQYRLNNCTTSAHGALCPLTVETSRRRYDIMLNWYRPSDVLKAVFCRSASSTSTCQYPFFRSSVVNSLDPAKVSSTRGRGYASILVIALTFL